MPKLPILSLILCLALLLSSCKKDENKYVEAQYVTDYCPKTGAALVSLLGDSEPSNQIALLNLPQSFQVKDKRFWITYHYDQALDKPDEGKICPDIFSPLKIFVCDSATEPTL